MFPQCEPVDVEDASEAEIAAKRLERQLKHEVMQVHIKYLIATHFGGKQVALADCLGVHGVWLCQYMTGKGNRGKLSEEELNRRRADMLRRLKLAKLPLETPTAAAVAEASTAAAAVAETKGASTRAASMAQRCHSTSAPSRARKKPTPARVPAFSSAASKGAVLTINLKNALGCREGGACSIMALGVPVLEDARWLLACPGNGEKQLRMRNGLRGRRTISPRSHVSVAGRTFEWWLEALDSRHEIAVHGGPLWVAREVGVSKLGERIIGRAPLDHGGHSGPSTPELLWQAISRHCGPDAPRLTAMANTGLVHPSVQSLLEAVDEDGDGLSSLTPGRGFGGRHGGVSGLGERRLRAIGEAAGTAFVQAMESVCPGEPHAAFAQLLKRRSFQAFLPEGVRKALKKNALRDAVLEMPFVEGLVEVYHKLEGFRARRQHLSLFAPFFPYKVTMELFGVKRWHVHQARLHSAEYSAERQVPPAVKSFRIKPEAATALNAFANSPENVRASHPILALSSPLHLAV